MAFERIAPSEVTTIRLAEKDKHHDLKAEETVVITVAGIDIANETVPAGKKWSISIDLMGIEENA